MTKKVRPFLSEPKSRASQTFDRTSAGVAPLEGVATAGPVESREADAPPCSMVVFLHTAIGSPSGTSTPSLLVTITRNIAINTACAPYIRGVGIFAECRW